MCGIAGFIDYKNNTDKKVLVEMTDAIEYRGPDDAGYDIFNSEYATIGFGHRRLSIIDLTKGGHQPMFFKNIAIIFNGEIYNYNEIKQDLIINHNCTFQSNSDTEVILQAFYIWGINCVHKFNGMFAIVIYDKSLEEIYLIRDRTGVKPLYYYYQNETLLFASELKSFHSHPSFTKKLQYDSLGLYLQYGYIPAPYTIFENALKVKPGSYVQVKLKSKAITESIYWDVLAFYNKPKLIVSYSDAINEVEDLLKSACNYRMVSDVPVGVFLSGGYDSSCVAAILQKDRQEKIKTFTIGFEEAKFNEAGYAKEVAQYLGTDHTEYYCSEKEAKEIIPKIAHFCDEPFGDSSIIPTMLVSKIAREKVTVALSADAGDETFAGYSRYLSLKKNFEAIQKIPALFRKPLGKTLQSLKPNFIINNIAKHRISNIYDGFAQVLKSDLNAGELTKITSQRISSSKVNALLKKRSREVSTFFDIDKELNSDNDVVSKAMAIDYKTYLVDDILVKVDRATMSVSLEGREPLLDYRLIEYAAQLPIGFKINSDGTQKRILKDIVHKYLPEQLMKRPKMGFAIPVQSWLRNDLADYVNNYLSKTYIEKQGVFDSTIMNTVVERFKQGNNDDAELIWFIVMFQLWHEKWMSN